jgi:hypothetical protein
VTPQEPTTAEEVGEWVARETRSRDPFWDYRLRLLEDESWLTAFAGEKALSVRVR